jgi:hypothetical protein
LANTSFEQLSGGRKRGEVDPASHYRRGEADSWKRELSAQEERMINNAVGDLLSLLGYET